MDAGKHQPVLTGLDPLPTGLRHGYLGIQLVERGGHLVVLHGAASRPAKFGALRLA